VRGDLLRVLFFFLFFSVDLFPFFLSFFPSPPSPKIGGGANRGFKE